MERCFFYCIDDGVAPQGLGDGRGMLDARRKVVLFGAMAVLMAGLTRFLYRSLRKMVWRMMAAAASECAHTVGLVCAPGSPSGGLVEATGLDDARWLVRSGHTAPIMTTPFIKFVGVTTFRGFRLILLTLCKALWFCLYY